MSHKSGYGHQPVPDRWGSHVDSSRGGAGPEAPLAAPSWRAESASSWRAPAGSSSQNSSLPPPTHGLQQQATRPSPWPPTAWQKMRGCGMRRGGGGWCSGRVWGMAVGQHLRQQQRVQPQPSGCPFPPQPLAGAGLRASGRPSAPPLHCLAGQAREEVTPAELLQACLEVCTQVRLMADSSPLALTLTLTLEVCTQASPWGRQGAAGWLQGSWVRRCSSWSWTSITAVAGSSGQRWTGCKTEACLAVAELVASIQQTLPMQLAHAVSARLRTQGLVRVAAPYPPCPQPPHHPQPLWDLRSHSTLTGHPPQPMCHSLTPLTYQSFLTLPPCSDALLPGQGGWSTGAWQPSQGLDLEQPSAGLPAPDSADSAAATPCPPPPSLAGSPGRAQLAGTPAPTVLVVSPHSPTPSLPLPTAAECHWHPDPPSAAAAPLPPAPTPAPGYKQAAATPPTQQAAATSTAPPLHPPSPEQPTDSPLVPAPTAESEGGQGPGVGAALPVGLAQEGGEGAADQAGLGPQLGLGGSAAVPDTMLLPGPESCATSAISQPSPTQPTPAAEHGQELPLAATVGQLPHEPTPLPGADPASAEPEPDTPAGVQPASPGAPHALLHGHEPVMHGCDPATPAEPQPVSLGPPQAPQGMPREASNEADQPHAGGGRPAPAAGSPPPTQLPLHAGESQDVNSTQPPPDSAIEPGPMAAGDLSSPSPSQPHLLEALRPGVGLAHADPSLVQPQAMCLGGSEPMHTVELLVAAAAALATRAEVRADSDHRSVLPGPQGTGSRGSGSSSRPSARHPQAAAGSSTGGRGGSSPGPAIPTEPCSGSSFQPVAAGALCSPPPLLKGPHTHLSLEAAGQQNGRHASDGGHGQAAQQKAASTGASSMAGATAGQSAKSGQDEGGGAAKPTGPEDLAEARHPAINPSERNATLATGASGQRGGSTAPPPASAASGAGHPGRRFEPPSVKGAAAAASNPDLHARVSSHLEGRNSGWNSSAASSVAPSHDGRTRPLPAPAFVRPASLHEHHHALGRQGPTACPTATMRTRRCSPLACSIQGSGSASQ
ncbi:hypothetical protein HaLaN_03326 [Haematococcus lacustris]|uniref:Uncharacterized protein n=1 Tax=Haematococcus lacustris TaxID=44745 RepID=A0A699YKA4_HAELA|nr:hypothetical protein HaLaN_03326 [Haematococcus lacustris]